MPDPIHEAAKAERERAEAFNREEQRLRRVAAEPADLKVKTYDNEKDYAHDARSMSGRGYVPQGETSGRGKVSIGGTAGKLILTGGLGAITGFSRKGNKITVTWVKRPAEHQPRDFRPIPEVPPARSFAAEPYFDARLTDPVPLGQEYPTPEALTKQNVERPQLAPATAAEPISSNSGSIAQRLRQLSDLKDSGLISDEEYAAKRAALLADL